MNPSLDAQLKNWLVKEAEDIADTAANQKGVQTSQLRNLMQVAQVESEVAVLRNFLQYQAGRKATKDFWRPIHEQVTSVLEEIPRRLESDDPVQRRLAIQRFFGYMVRRYVYQTELKKSQRWGKPGGGGRSHGGRQHNRGGSR